MKSKKEDRTDPICGMKGIIRRYGYYFCSLSGVKKYEKEHGIKGEKCAGCAAPAKKWYRERLSVVSLFVTAVLAISYFVDFLRPLTFAFLDYLG